MSREYISFPTIVAELKNLCAEGITGTLFVATDANRSLQIMIENGEIVFISFYNKRGQAAVEFMPTIVAGKSRFQSSSTVIRRDPSLQTQKIIEFLEKETNEVALFS